MKKNCKSKMIILLFILLFNYSDKVESLNEKDIITNEINKSACDTNLNKIQNVSNNAISDEKKVKSNSAIEDAQEILKKIYQTCSEKNYEKLKNYIYPFYHEGMGYTSDLIIEGIIENDNRGDYAYSYEALTIIISSYLNEIKPISKNYLEQLFLSGGQFALDTTLKTIAQKSPEDIMILDKEVLIVMVKVKNEWKLLFWENMNKVIK